MGKILDKFYAQFANPGVLNIITKRKISIDWAIEAGCHDGSDTLQIAKLPYIQRIYAFEPDPIAAAIAQAKFNKLSGLVKLLPFALWSTPGFVEMLSPTGLLGDGNSIFRFHGKFEESQNLNAIPCTTLDLEINANSGNGLLWLDVEGVPHFVLEGSIETLKCVVIAQIEVEMHKMSDYRNESFTEVHKIMRRSNFKLYKAALHPGFFGDVIYLKADKLSKQERLICVLLTLLVKFLHSAIYPIMNKPGRI